MEQSNKRPSTGLAGPFLGAFAMVGVAQGATWIEQNNVVDRLTGATVQEIHDVGGALEEQSERVADAIISLLESLEKQD